MASSVTDAGVYMYVFSIKERVSVPHVFACTSRLDFSKRKLAVAFKKDRHTDAVLPPQE